MPSGSLAPGRHQCLSFQINQFLQHLIRGGYNPGIGLEASLGGNHIGKLLGQVHIGHFQAAGNNGPHALFTRRTDIGVPGVVGNLELVGSRSESGRPDSGRWPGPPGPGW